MLGFLLLASLLIPGVIPENVPGYNKLSWFLQITDIHISTVQDKSRTDQFRLFSQDYLRIYNPDLVICSGDLTDAKIQGGLSSSQVDEEWKIYYDIVRNRSREVPWLDIRGNHDALNVLSRNSENNKFRNYSVMGREGFTHSYIHSTRIRNQQYNFVGIDATLETGLRYPFNFVGDIPESEQNLIRNLTSKINAEDVTIFFGHYPSSVVRQTQFLLDTVSEGLVYLCGHLHDLAFFRMHTMYSLHGGDNLELELIDWKSNRGYRLLAVDQGFISFTDLRFNEWPVVLPTIPKNSEFLLDSREPSLNPEMFNSVRVLVFSDARIKTVLTQINEETPSQAQQVEDGPLYSSVWNPENYKTGLHRLTVTVTDARNRTKVIQQSFTLDKTETKRFSRFLSNLVLNSSFSTLFQVLFVLSALGAITSLPLVRLISNLFIQRRLPSLLNKLVTSLIKSCLFRKLLYVSSSRLFFYFFTLYPVYLAVGPWVVGSIIESEYGAIFAWGALVGDKFVPAQVGFLYYFLQFLIIHPGAVLACGHIIDWRNRVTDSRCWFGFQHCSVFSILLVAGALSILFSISFWLQFGPLGFFVGPLRTWSYPLYGLMIFLSFRVEVPSKYSGLYLTDPGKKSDDICLEEEEEDEEGHLRRDP